MGLKDKILMNCQNATSIVEKKRDGRLTLIEKIGLWIHLGYCSICKLFFTQSEIIDKSFLHYAGQIDLGKTVHSLHPDRKEALSKAFKEELNK